MNLLKMVPRTVVPAKAAGHADADLRRYAVQYRGGTIRVTETFRALDHSEPVLAVGGCALSHHLDYANARAVITVPASCLGSPQWIRFEFEAVTTDSWRNPSYLYADVAPGTSVMRDRYTPRIHRG